MRLLTVVLTLLAAGCSSTEIRSTEIRLIKRSDVPLEKVVVEFPSGIESYGTVPPGGATDYHQVERAYGYAYVEATIEGQPAILQPIDYVGEELLGNGAFAYALTYNKDADSTYERMRLELVRE